MTLVVPGNPQDIPAAPSSRGTALLADDELSNRVVLSALLKKMGYQILQAENGAQAVELFKDKLPDIVFMDVMMPIMDGLEATTHIKSLSGDRFVPVIFLTALTDEKALARCIDVGGDDFLTKPFSHTVLRSKIQAMERIRDLHREVSRLYGQQQQEQEIAEKVFNGAVLANNVATDHIHTLMKPAALFSGDVLLTAFTPTGNLHVLLGDFTGHGLYAALGALPVSETFRAMTLKGFAIEQILNEINRKLYSLLPTGMFMAAQFACVNVEENTLSLCNCGMPDMLILDESGNIIKERIEANSVPLGIIASSELKIPIRNIETMPGDRLLLATDGIVEARSPEGELFGQQRLEALITDNLPNTSVVAKVKEALEGFCQDATQDDDISMVEIPCLPSILTGWEAIPAVKSETYPLKSTPIVSPVSDILELSLTLKGPRLLRSNPVPILIDQIQELENLEQHRRALFTILSELFINALDHGVLGIDSKLKHQPDGFSHYFLERERRLESLVAGQVMISVKSQILGNNGTIVLRVEDSGLGFNYGGYLSGQDQTAHALPSGRGILLVNELCESVHYEEPGNKVEVVYRW
jgi:serine phosphatase RsbU (regulator of sigma subunit)